MNKHSIAVILGRLLMLYSLSLLPVILITLFNENSESRPFVITFFQTLAIGFVVYLSSYRKSRNIQAGIKEGFLIVVLYWLVIGVICAIPFYLSTDLGRQLSIAEALFESFSGLTTTGATILNNLDTLPPAILYYRQQLQWLGGMGIIVLAVAVLPALGVGAVLFRAEICGPFKSSNLAPRVSETAKRLWYIYCSLTFICALCYWLAGMSLFDAINHSFSTIAIGGFSTHDASMGYFDNIFIEMVAVVFMIVAGINFSMHFTFLRNPSLKTLKNYFLETETRVYLIFICATVLLTLLILYFNLPDLDLLSLLRQGIFNSVSIATTTGFTTVDWSLWPYGLPMLLLFASFVGGCSGSTAGGIKVVRFIVICKHAMREVLLLMHPNAIKLLTLNGKFITDKTIHTIIGFFTFYFFTFIVLMLLLMLTGMEPLTAFSGLVACLNNLGPALEEIALNYQSLNDASKLVLSFAMLLGRLEFYTLLLLLTPLFWKT